MKGVFLNIRGVGKKDAISCVKDLMYDYCLDFIGLQESIKKDYDIIFLEN
jgi:hypothetical protein